MRLTCKVTALNAELDTTIFESAQFLEALRDHFLRDSNGAIDLDTLFAPIEPILAANQPARDGDLHFGMRELTQNPSSPPIDTIGLLVASSHENDQRMFGLMFDQGLAQVPGDFDAAVPREGAAVFLDSIAARRTSDDLFAEVLFTSIHELGHAFNLSHAPQEPATFMSRSAVNASAYDSSAFFFSLDHSGWLGQAEVDFRVRPGESVFLDRDSRNAVDIPSAGDDEQLILTAAMHPAECLGIEPIHLDLRLHCRRGGQGRQVPRMLDPSHTGFRIFIEEPSGRSRLYRNSVHCCPTARRLSIAPSEDFRRDIMLTMEGGRYTFREPGTYRLRVEFDCSLKHTLRSNVTEIHILAKPERSFEPIARALLSRDAAHVVQYGAFDNVDVMHGLARLIRSWKGRWSERRSLIAYRWAVAVLRNHPEALAPELEAHARDFLSRCRELRDHRGSRAEELLRKSSRRRARYSGTKRAKGR